MDEKYIVYIKTNGDGYITAVNSSAFLTDTTDWVDIDRGYGDKYHHAQGHYFPQPVMTEDGAYRYKLVDAKPVECTEEEIAEQEAAAQPETESSQNGESVWDELDAAYQAGYAEGYAEGVNSAYDQ